MLTTLTLSGVWLLASHVLAVLVGLFSSQYVKDTLKGVPSQLRTALKAHESNALTALKDAEAKVVSDTMAKLGMPAPAAKPAAAVKPAAPAVGADILTALKGAAKAIEDAAVKLSAPAVPATATTTAAPATATTTATPATATPAVPATQ